MLPIDLAAIAASHNLRTCLDESAGEDPGVSERAWMIRLFGTYGFVSPHSRDLLSAYTGRRGIISRLIEIEGVIVHQRGDAEVRILFTPDKLDQVAELLRLRRKRRVSDTTRERLKAIGFKPQTARRTLAATA